MNERDIEQYIYKKAEEISVPPSLSPETMEKRLSEVKPKKSHTFRFRYRLVAAAACLFLLVIGGITAKQYLTTDNYPIFKPAEKDAGSAENSGLTADVLGYDKAYEAIEQYYKHQESPIVSKDKEAVVNRPEADMAETENSTGSDEANASAKSKPATPDYSETDLQVQDVMEGDVVKTDGNYIYRAKDNSTGSVVNIHSVNGKEVKEVSNIELENRSILEMYLDQNRLILISAPWGEENEEQTCFDYEMETISTTEITIYDISEPQSPKKIRTQTQSGCYATSRVSDGYLYTFSRYSIEETGLNKDEPKTYIPQVNDTCIKSENVHCLSGVYGRQYMVMTSLLLDGSAKFKDSICSLGGAEVFYVSSENIYFTHYEYAKQNTSISKYSYTEGSFRFVAKRKVRGQIRNSYYLHEYNGNLCYVYTNRQNDNSTTNGIVMLDSKLKKLGELENLGKNERIYSSYYIGHMAYFVTYRETDPVFAVDISNPKKLKLLSELKIPGFSSYLHSFGDGLLLGIGEQETNGEQDWDFRAKLSVFSIENKEDVKEIAKKLLFNQKDKDKWGNSSTYAAENHKAVFVDEERKLFGFSVQYENEYNSSTCYEVYSYADNKLTKILSQKGISSFSQVRGIRIGNYFYVVDSFSISVYEMPESGQTTPMTKIN